ncbi:MAG: hypothetical protein ACREIW_08745, partial [Chthoniobacterales bacterium]
MPNLLQAANFNEYRINVIKNPTIDRSSWRQLGSIDEDKLLQRLRNIEVAARVLDDLFRLAKRVRGRMNVGPDAKCFAPIRQILERVIDPATADHGNARAAALPP